MTQGERVKQIRKSLNMTLDKFGEKLGVTKQTVSRIENGINNLTDQMFKAICREFNVNENWLRAEEEPMFVQMTQDERVTNIVRNALASDDEFVINTFTALGQLSPSEWDVMKKFINTIKGDNHPTDGSTSNSSSSHVKSNTPIVIRAAHENPGATKEQIEADNAMMEGDDF